MRNQVNEAWKPKVLKENKTPQRSDVSLTNKIATALTQKIFSGETLYPPSGYLPLPIDMGGGEEKIITLSNKTLNAWVTRGNVVPETGEVLRDILNEARERYRSNERKKRAEKMLSKLEYEFCRTMSLRTNVPVIGIMGTIKDPRTGKILHKEDVTLLQTKMDTAKFLVERLDPQRYGKNINKKHPVLTFSLAELRKAKEEIQEA